MGKNNTNTDNDSLELLHVTQICVGSCLPYLYSIELGFRLWSQIQISNPSGAFDFLGFWNLERDFNFRFKIKDFVCDFSFLYKS